MHDGVVIVNGDIGFPYDLEGIPLYKDGCGFVEADADEFGRYVDKAGEVELAVASEEVLVDDGILQKA
jgi:hypothetical protein